MNKNVSDYIKYYLDLKDEPQYAVQITGGWGVGKTFFMKDLLLNKGLNEPECIYISLYGVTDLNQIDQMIYRKKHPVLSSRQMKLAFQVIKGLSRGAIDIEGEGGVDRTHEFDFSEVDIPTIERDKSTVYVFDDLERCELKKSDVLGYINRFVEHLGKKVVILTNEEKIGDPDYREQKEKLIGASFEYRCDVRKVLDHFLKTMNNVEYRKLLEKYKENIIFIYNHSEKSNLRMLRNSIAGFERILVGLEPALLKNEDFIKGFIVSHFTLSMYVYSGDVKASELEELLELPYGGGFYGGGDGEAETNAQKVLRMHFENSRENIIPSVKVFSEYFRAGFVDSKLMKEEVANCVLISDTIPEWQMLWRHHDCSVTQFNSLFERVYSDFMRGKFTREGELKHVACLLLGMTKEKLNREPYQKMKSAVFDQVRRLVDERKVEYIDLMGQERLEIDRGYAGLGFYQPQNPDTVRLFKMLDDGQEIQIIDHLSIIAKELPNKLKTNPKEFYRLLCSATDGALASYPVLKYVDGDELLRAFSDMSTETYTLGQVFRARYKSRSRRLRSELSWLKEFLKLLKRAIKVTTEPLYRYRLDGVLSNAQSAVMNLKSTQDVTVKSKRAVKKTAKV